MSVVSFFTLIYVERDNKINIRSRIYYYDAARRSSDSLHGTHLVMLWRIRGQWGFSEAKNIDFGKDFDKERCEKSFIQFRISGTEVLF